MKLIVVKHLDRASVLEVKVVVFRVYGEWEYMYRVRILAFPTTHSCEYVKQAPSMVNGA